jgi:hypothetical protein
MPNVFQASAVALLAVGSGTAAVNVMNKDVADMEVPAGPWQPGTQLDGLVFYTTDRILGSDEVLEDELHFKDGTFQSAMCQEYCDFGWTPYRTWAEGDVIHFTTSTSCPDAPHTVVWYGTVTDGRVEMQVSWTTRRWYWTHQINGVGEGGLEPPAGVETTG